MNKPTRRVRRFVKRKGKGRSRKGTGRGRGKRRFAFLGDMMDNEIDNLFFGGKGKVSRAPLYRQGQGPATEPHRKRRRSDEVQHLWKRHALQSRVSERSGGHRRLCQGSAPRTTLWTERWRRTGACIHERPAERSSRHAATTARSMGSGSTFRVTPHERGSASDNDLSLE